MRTVTRFLSGLILGGVVGATLALLLTPTSGDELRNRVQIEIGRVQTDVRQAAEDRRAELEEQLAALRAPRKPQA